MPSLCLFVCPSVRIEQRLQMEDFLKFHIWGFFKTLSRKFKFHQNLTRIADILHEDQHTFIIISRSLLLIMRNFSEKCCREDKNTHLISITFYFSESRAVYEITWKSMADLQQDRPHTIYYGTCALYAKLLRSQTNTQNV